MLNAKVHCVHCGKEISISSQDVKTKKAHINQKDFEVLYSKCPECGKEIYVQVDDSYTYQQKKEVTKCFVRLAKKRQNHLDISKKQNEQFQKKRKQLIKIRKDLEKLLEGKVCIDEFGNEFVMRVSK